MPKISSLNAKSVIIKFIIKSILLTAFTTVLFSALFSFICLKIDLDLDYIKYCGYMIGGAASFIVAHFCLKSFKNNISILSFISIIPLVLLSFINFLVFNKDFVQFFISLAIIITVSFLTGVLSAGKRR